VTAGNSRLLAGAAGAVLAFCDDEVPRDIVPTPCLSAALKYAALRICVFPLGAGKRPLRNCPVCRRGGPCPGRDDCRCGVNTCHGFYAATTNVTTITDWWGSHPQWQLGIRTGSGSRIVALDVDVDRGGLDSLPALQAGGFDIGGVAIQLSGSRRSFHLLFAHPGSRVPNSQGTLGSGLDVRGDGGYVVGAPSLHASTGLAYVLLGDLRGLPVWPFPAAAVACPQPRTPKDSARLSVARAGGPMTPARLAALVGQVRQAAEGQRRSTLFWAACRLGESSGRQSVLLAAAELLLQAGQDAGLAEAEAYATLQDGVCLGRAL